MEAARRRCYFMDSKGLVCAARIKGLQPHKLPFAHDVPHQATLLGAVEELKPTGALG